MSSRAALAALAALAAGCGPEESAGGPEPEPAHAPSAVERQAFAARFRERAAAAGLDFRHATGARGAKWLPETMGSGVAVLDFDGDGALDLFLVNSGVWSALLGPGETPGETPTSALYRGRGDGSFERMPPARGADLAIYGMGAAAADCDGDGDTDVFVTALGGDVLLVNEGGRFRDGTAQAGLSGPRWTAADGSAHPSWSTAAAWFDADRDGDLDLFVGGYCEWTPEIEVFTTLDGVDKAFTTPDRYVGLPCRLYENRGDGTFAERLLPTAGGEPALGKALGAAVWDFDGDGLLDVAVANDTQPNFLFENLGECRFRERGFEAGIAYDENGRARAGMGIAVAPWERAGSAPAALLVIANYAGESLSAYATDGEAAFVSVAREVGLALPTQAPLAFGVAFADLDLDGWLDLIVANGHIEPEIARFRPGQTHAQALQIFRGLPDGSFEDVSAEVGADVAEPRVARGLAVADLDRDGDLDLVVTTNGGPPALLENELQAERPAHWLRVELAGRAANTAALGAEIEIEAGGRVQRRLVHTGSSYLSQSDPAPTFGLGASARVERLTVRWPAGGQTELRDLAADRTLRVAEGD